ncbi:hypothetical protein LguiA_004714 [Lonicera macranthoides]
MRDIKNLGGTMAPLKLPLVLSLYLTTHSPPPSPPSLSRPKQKKEGNPTLIIAPIDQIYI